MCSGEAPAPRHFHNTVFMGRRMYIFGGYDGLPAMVRHHKAAGGFEEIPAKVTGFMCDAGDAIQLIEPNGGGYGNPLKRDPKLVVEDILDDFTSVELAREAYGVVVDPKTLAIDAAATKKLRAKLLKQRGRNFQGELLSLVKLPHRMAVSPHKAAAKPKRKKAATRR